jgi:hypothetical protein
VPTLNIEGRKVTVDDSFLKLSPEQQNSTVEEIASSFKAPSTGRLRVTPADQPQTFEGGPPGVGEDVARSAGAGAVSGAAMFAGGAGDLRQLLSHGVSYAAEKLGIPADKVDQFKSLIYEGASRASPATSMLANAPTTEDVSRFAGGDAGARNIVGQTMDYQPQTKAGAYAKTAAEFLPAAVGGEGGLIARGARVLAPAIASETAGQLTKGTKAEPVARFLAALAGGGATALASRPGTAARALAQQLPDGITEQMVNQADALMQEAAGRGIRLAWPEALSQVAGRPVLTNMMRHLEASPQTEGQMGEFFAGRPQAVEGAVRGELDNIAPVNRAPSSIGPQVGRAAEETVGDVRGAINRTAEPFYRNAEAVQLAPADMQRVEALPGYQQARDAVRNDPQLNRYVAHLPDNSVGFLNEVKKQLDQAARAERNPINIQGNQQRVAGIERDAAAVRQTAQNASQDYATALGVESYARERYLQPLLDGPLGKIAGRDTTTKNAIDALFPRNPLPNSEQEIGTAVSALAHRNQRAARDLVRAHAESTFNEAARDLQTGPNQANGAKFRVAIAGNPQQRANLQAAVEALPNGQERWQGFNRLLDVLEATGTRQNVGSRTAYNAEINKAQGAGGLVRDATKIAGNPTKLAQPLIDKYEQWKLGRNLSQLADILTDQRSVGLLRNLARVPQGEWRRAAGIATSLIASTNAARQINKPSGK